MLRKTVPALLATFLATGCGAGYVVRSGWFQAELLLSRRSAESLRREGGLPPDQLQRLDLVADVKRYGERIGLSATGSYDSVAVGWDRTIWNLSASQPLSFTPATWWFPVVGRVPYLGYFRERDARREAERLGARGLDVYLRTAGAYSTLGWFRDPVLPEMLRWPEDRLAETVLHEMTHATLWVRGSVHFNESFANFVGRVASMRYLSGRYGPGAAPVLEARRRREDLDTWASLERTLYRDLEAVYGNPTLDEAEKLEAKRRLFAAFPARVDAAPFHEPERFRRAARSGTWNNARLLQFRAYDSAPERFQALLQASGGDLSGFISRVRELTRGASDPFLALDGVQES